MTNDRLLTDLKRLEVKAPQSAVNAAIAVSHAADGYVTRRSPVGVLYVAFNERGVSAVDLADSPADFEERFLHLHGRPALAVDRLPTAIDRHLDLAIESGRPGRLPLDLSGLTPFQAAVLLKTAEIPGGQVRPYGWIAKEIGKPGAVRAVGSALAKNPVPVVIPCHRVVRSDGHLGNYSLGDPENKKVLLDAEGLDVVAFEAMSDRGVRFIGSDTTDVFCNPTCQHARRISPQHTVEFRSETEARTAGFRPCKVCRPATAAA
jgi:O-6-methylguanine DNA methyltransferase